MYNQAEDTFFPDPPTNYTFQVFYLPVYLIFVFMFIIIAQNIQLLTIIFDYS